MEHIPIFGTPTHETKIDCAWGQNENRGDAKGVFSCKSSKQRGQTWTSWWQSFACQGEESTSIKSWKPRETTESSRIQVRFRFSSHHESSSYLRWKSARFIIHHFSHQDDHAIPVTDTPGFKPFTMLYSFLVKVMRWYFSILFPIITQ